MQVVFGGVLALTGAILIGLAYHNQIAAAWQVIIS